MEFENERRQIINACRTMQQLGFFLGTWGNVSIRIQDCILLTPSRVEYDIMTPEDIVVIDMSGNKISGERNPTSEKEVHRQIYNKRNDIGGIIHSHSLYATAACVGTYGVPPVTEEMSQLLGGAIPITDRYVPAEQHQLFGRTAAEAISDKNAVLLRNHGPVCCGRDISEAILTARVVEKACRIYLTLNPTNVIHIIDDEYVASEHYRYVYKYGKENT